MKNYSLLLVCLIVPLYSKVLIITHAFNRPDFIELQHKTFKKFLKDDYEFVVFSDAANNPFMQKRILETCAKLNIHCITIPQQIHDQPYLYRAPREQELWNSPNVRTANVIQYSLDTLGFKFDGTVAIIDSDMFLIKPFSIEKFLHDYDIAGVPQSRGMVHYLWNGIVFFNMNSLPEKTTINWNCGLVQNEPTDVGGYTYYYFKAHPEVKTKYINVAYIKDNPEVIALLKKRGLSKVELSFLINDRYGSEFHLDKTFLHYRAGGNWTCMPSDYHSSKTFILNKFMHACLHK